MNLVALIIGLHDSTKIGIERGYVSSHAGKFRTAGCSSGLL